MARLFTHADIVAVPDGGDLFLETDDQLTPLAEERIAARGIRVLRGQPGPSATPGIESLIEEVTQQVVARAGAAPELVRQVVAEVLGPAGSPGASDPAGPGYVDYCATFLEQQESRARSRAVLTTTGRNRKGIVARITTRIAELEGDILDLSQTLVGDYFTMILVVDTAGLRGSFAGFRDAMAEVARELGIQAMVMHEDIVTSLHRV